MIPFSMHRVIDIVFGAAMLVSPFVLSYDAGARTFFVAMGVVSLVVVALTDFSRAARSSP
jgi:hypothetical protein